MNKDIENSIHYGYSFDILIFERIASPYTLSFLTKPDEKNLTVDNFLSLSFQLVWFFYWFRQAGYSHNDIKTTNIWLQPIKPQYKYILYEDGERVLGIYLYKIVCTIF